MEIYRTINTHLNNSNNLKCVSAFRTHLRAWSDIKYFHFIFLPRSLLACSFCSGREKNENENFPRRFSFLPPPISVWKFSLFIIVSSYLSLFFFVKINIRSGGEISNLKCLFTSTFWVCWWQWKCDFLIFSSILLCHNKFKSATFTPNLPSLFITFVFSPLQFHQNEDA